MSFDVWNRIHVFCVQPKRQKQMLQFKFTIFYYHKRKGQIRPRKTHLDTVLISLLFFTPSPASFFHINLAGWLCFATIIAWYVYQPYSRLVPFCIPKITSFTNSLSSYWKSNLMLALDTLFGLYIGKIL